MRYVFVSDIHGNFAALQTALSKVNFNRDEDTIVSLGDPFDRGSENLAVLKFLLQCPNRILLWGNHDRRLHNLLFGSGYFFDAHDYNNGLDITLAEFAHTADLAEGMEKLLKGRGEMPLLKQYFNECCFAIETPDFIATHAWTPMSPFYSLSYFPKDEAREYWKTASIEEWENALWTNSLKYYRCGAYPNKKLVIGHFYTWCFRHPEYMDLPNKEFFKLQLETDIWTSPDNCLTAIDGCSCLPEMGGKINTYIYESDAVFIRY